jgi:hypothetical protein
MVSMPHDSFRLTIGLFAIGIIFSFLGAVIAFIVSYQGYRDHFMPKDEMFRLSMRSGRFAFIIFLILSMLLAVMLRRIIS